MTILQSFRRWLGWLFDSALPEVAPEAPRARLSVVVGMLALVAALVLIRYRLGVLPEDRWYAAYLAVGYVSCFGLLAAGHGGAWLGRIQRKSWAILAIGATTFCAFWYFGRIDSYWRWWSDFTDTSHPLAPLVPFFYFSGASALFRLALPFAIAYRWLGLSPAQLGLPLPWRGPKSPPLAPLYLLLFLGVLPFVVYAAGTPAFLAKYPLCRDILTADRSVQLDHLLLYQAAYVMVFVAGEAFWRGFLVFGTVRDFGAYAIPLMVLPYTLAHFGKPLPETLGSIAAGSVLAWLALKHRSVWLGVALHYAVALTMDLLAIRAAGIVVR